MKIPNSVQDFIDSICRKFSNDSRTQKAYLKVFNLIFEKFSNPSCRNEFGYAKIHSDEFKQISRRKYKEILLNLKSEGVIWTDFSLNQTHLGKDIKNDNHFVRGFCLQRDFVQKHFSEQEQNIMLEKVNPNSQNISAKLKTNSNSFQNKKDSIHSFLIQSPIPFQSLISYGGAQSPDRNSDYNLEKAYEFVQLDVSSIQYNPGDDDFEQFRKIWNGHAPVKKVRNRIYSWFHSLKKEQRSWLMIDGSHLTQAFDIKSCNFSILGKLLENTDVDKTELGKYQKMMKEKYIYAEIAEYAGLEFTKDLKDMLKKSCQHWLNIRKRWVNSGKNTDENFYYVDTFFKNNFPSIYEIILNWREENYLGKKSKMLWDDYQKVEFEIISEKMTNYLWKEYGVISLSVHDALYISMKDKNKIPESIEELFWKNLDYKFI